MRDGGRHDRVIGLTAGGPSSGHLVTTLPMWSMYAGVRNAVSRQLRSWPRAMWLVIKGVSVGPGVVARRETIGPIEWT